MTPASALRRSGDAPGGSGGVPSKTNTPLPTRSGASGTRMPRSPHPGWAAGCGSAGGQEDRDDRSHRVHRRAVAVEDSDRAARDQAVRAGPPQGLGRGSRPGARPDQASRSSRRSATARGSSSSCSSSGSRSSRATCRTCHALPADLDILVHCAGDVSFDPPIDQAFIDQRGRHPRPAESDDRGGDRRVGEAPDRSALCAHLHRVHRGTAARGHSGGSSRAQCRLPGRDGGRAGHARADRGRVADSRAAHCAAQAGRAGAPPSRLPDHRRRHRAPPAGVGGGGAGQGGRRACAIARLDRRIHLHQGARRATGGRRWCRPPGLDRAPGHRRVLLAAPVPGLDRGLQDGRAAHLGVRPRRTARVSRVAGLGAGHRVVRLRGERDPCRLRHQPRARPAGVLPRQLRGAEPAELQCDVQPHPQLLHRPPAETPTGPGEPLPEWDFPGAASVDRLLSTSERAHGLAERVISQAPRSDRTRQLARDLDRIRRRLDFFRRYHSLVQRVRPVRAALRRRQHPGADPGAAPCRRRQRSPSTPLSTTGRPTSRTCTARRSPLRSAGWTRCGASGAIGPAP